MRHIKKIANKHLEDFVDDALSELSRVGLKMISEALNHGEIKSELVGDTDREIETTQCPSCGTFYPTGERHACRTRRAINAKSN